MTPLERLRAAVLSVDKKVLSLVKAIALLVAGATLVALFSDPMVSAVNRLSALHHINSFFISFIVTPLASNASEFVASLYFCAKKTSKSVSVAFVAPFF